MKNRIFSRVLALFIALSMLTTTVFAASFDDLQAAIDGAGEQTEATTPVDDAKPADEMPETSEPDAPEAPAVDSADPEDTTHVNGALVRTENDINYFGYGWSSVTEGETTTWSYAIEAHDEQGNRFVVLLDDVSKGNGEGALSGVVIKADKDNPSKVVDIDMNSHEIKGDSNSTVIKVETGANLDLSNGTISGGQIGIDVLGTLILDTVTVTNNGTGVKINDGGKVTFKGDNKFTDNGADVELKVGEKTFKVDAKTAEALLKNSGEVVDGGTTAKKNAWLLAKDKDGAYTVAYIGTGDKVNQLTSTIVNDVLTAGAGTGADKKTITGFVIPEGVTSIGEGAFFAKKTLQTIKISDSVTEIGSQALSLCTALEEIVIPESVKSCGKLFMSGCTSLKHVEILGSCAVYGQMFEGNKNLEYVKISDNVTAIGRRAFVGCTKLKTLILPETVHFEEIGESAFAGCIELQGTITIPNGVKTIGSSAFERCNQISEVKLPNTVTTIGGFAFSACSDLTTIDLPNSVTTIGNQAFANCGALTKFVIPESVNSIGANVFNNTTNLEHVEILGSVKISQDMFNTCGKLNYLKISDKVTGINKYAFYGFKNLKTLDLPETASFTEIGEGAFMACGLEEISIPKGVTSIGKEAFLGCKAITISIPDTVTTIGESAFSWCQNLKTVTIPASVTEVGNSIIGDSGVMSIFVSSGDGSEDTAKLVADKTDVNIFIKDNTENLSFCRGNVFADFGHYNADADVNLEDGSVALLTNVSGTIAAGDKMVILPNVAGIEASIDTNGNITVKVPSAITVNGTEYPDGADVTVDPKGNITVNPHEPPQVELPVISFDFDTTTADSGTTIADNAIPLAGLISRAQLVSYLYAREGSPNGEDAEGEYTLAWAWGVENEVVDEEDDPEEIVTVAIFREIMTNYAKLLNTTFDVVIEDEDDMPLMNCDEILAEFYASLKSKAA